MVKKAIPQRGDIMLLDFDPTAGHEQKGKRPALVLSPQNYNEKTGLCLCVPITSKVKGYPFEVLLPEYLVTKGAVLSDQLRVVDWKERRGVVLEHMEGNEVFLVLQRARLLLK